MQFRPHTLMAALIIAPAALSSAYAEYPPEPLRLDVFTTEDRPVRGATEFLDAIPVRPCTCIGWIASSASRPSCRSTSPPTSTRRGARPSSALQGLSKERQEQLEQTANGLALALQLASSAFPPSSLTRRV